MRMGMGMVDCRSNESSCYLQNHYNVLSLSSSNLFDLCKLPAKQVNHLLNQKLGIYMQDLTFEWNCCQRNSVICTMLFTLSCYIIFFNSNLNI